MNEIINSYIFIFYERNRYIIIYIMIKILQMEWWNGEMNMKEWRKIGKSGNQVIMKLGNDERLLEVNLKYINVKI